jgi:hypothetical protein
MARENTNGKKFNGQQSLNSAIKSICDIMRRSNCAGALQYVPELTWILFLRILDEQEAKDAERAEAVGAELTLSLESPYRWQDWGTPGRAPAGMETQRTCRRHARRIQGLCGWRIDSPPQETEGAPERYRPPKSHLRNLLRH